VDTVERENFPFAVLGLSYQREGAGVTFHEVAQSGVSRTRKTGASPCRGVCQI
jgi:hypothetical protein